ncbi:leucine-rich repeat domain-containing protein [Anabaena sp. WFMT]|uniref:leucine-rich repeat domain-containing protein n=1 Tax=Anabaena sp. WFMT TaxID=3449730 RepID=UPI003F23C8B8
MTEAELLQAIEKAARDGVTELDLSGYFLSNLPGEIGQLTNLQHLNLGDNQLSSLPQEIGQLTNLQSLDFFKNQLGSLPQEIGQLTNLQTLNLWNNQLTSLPQEIGQLTNLQTLDLWNNQLTSLPPKIGQLTNLQTLDLRSNQLNSLPSEIGQFTNLQSFDLSFNQLSSLPSEIGQLTNLQTLYLSDNKLSSLPPEIGQLTKLKQLELQGNKIITLPLEITKQGLQAILNFYQQQLKQTVDLFYEAKFLIVGEGGAGKTSLAKKIEDENYKLQSNEKSTEGIDVIQWKFKLDNGKEFRVNIWDFGGQEIYHQTHQFFLTSRSLYALVADDRKENTDFYYWLKVVELLSESSPVIIIKNEKQERQCEVNERQLRGEFLNLKEVLPTNLATNRGLTEIKTAIQQYINKLPHVGTPLPKIWVKIRSDLENDSRNYINFVEYSNFCEYNGLTKREDMLLLSSYLHDLGVGLHFQDDPILKHYVILKPEWGTTAVYKVLDNKNVIKNLGCFTQENLAEIWKDVEYTDMRDELLQLMMRFKLCYPIPNCVGQYIAPQLLDINQPEYDWDKSHNLILRYKYEFMPKGIISRFIVETHPWIEEQKIVWRSGVILNQYQTRAEVIENYNQKEIKIRVAGNRKKELLTVITHELDKIHRSFKRLKYDTLVPCNCEKCIESENPYTYPLNELHEFLTTCDYDIQCRISRKMVDVRRLIDDVNLPPQELYQERQTPVTPLQNELDNQKKESFNVINIHNHVTTKSNSMSESSKYNLTGANVGAINDGQSGGSSNVYQTNYTPEQKQNLAEAAAEIQQLFHQLSKNNQTSTNEGITNAIYQEIKRNPTLKSRLISALKAGGLEALKAIFNHPVFSIPAETIKGFLEAE